MPETTRAYRRERPLSRRGRPCRREVALPELPGQAACPLGLRQAARGCGTAPPCGLAEAPAGPIADISGATHVLLSDICLSRRPDRAEVIGAALTAVFAGGEAHTDTACRLGVPPDTVFEWLRRFRRRAGAIASHFVAWFVALVPGAALPEPKGRPTSHALELVGEVARAASLRLGARPTWSWASALTGGALLSNTSSPFRLPA